MPGWELFGRAQGSNAGRGARGGAFGSGSRKRGRKGAAAFAQGAGACASPWAKEASHGRFGPGFSPDLRPKQLTPWKREKFQTFCKIVSNVSLASQGVELKTLIP